MSITDTNRMGVVVSGNGTYGNINRNMIPDNWETVYSKPNEDGAAITYSGSNGQIKDKSFWGLKTPNSPDSEKIPIGLLVTKREKGLGTGKMGVENTFFDGFQTGIQFALEVKEHNCDCSIFYNTYFKNCDTCVLLNNIMAMGHTFIHTHLADCKIGWLVKAGGDLWISNVTAVSQMTLLNIDAKQSSVSRNNGMFTLDNVKFDRQADGSVILKSSACNASFFLNRIHCPVNKSNVWLDISAGNHVVLKESRGLNSKCIKWNGDCCVKISDCRLLAKDTIDLFDTESSSGTLNIKIQDCVLDNCSLSNDFKGSIVGLN